MLITSHISATLIFANYLSLKQPEIYAALISGVGIDIDHLFVNEKWKKDIKDFFISKKITYGVNQHNWLQEIIFGMSVGSVAGTVVTSFFPTIRWWIIPFFLLLHILMDGIMHYEHQPFVPFSKWRYNGWLKSGTKVELIISTSILIIIFLS